MGGTDSRKLDDIKTLIDSGHYSEAFNRLSQTALPWSDFSTQRKYLRLFQKLPKDTIKLHPIRVALLSTSTMEHFADLFQFWMALNGFAAEMFLSPFNTVDQSILDPTSDLYAFQPDIIWLFTGHRGITADIDYGSDLEAVQRCLQEAVDRMKVRWRTLRTHRPTVCLIQNNIDLPVERVFGNFDGVVAWGTINILRQLNLRLPVEIPSGTTVFDLDHLSSLFGKRRWFDERYWYHSKHAFSFDAIGLVAHQGARLISSIKGRARKCIILDLDNTLWGGVIGDDGLEGIRLGSGVEGEGFVDFQRYLLKLKARGIILAVCSKNEEVIAKMPFTSHPDMHLRLEDISVFVANWKNKVDNIRFIADTLNLGLDAMVFIDDNPVERELVRDMLPMVEVPELPEDPTQYIRVIDEKAYFETIAFSKEDGLRSEMYRRNAQRRQMETEYTDLSAFLRDLSMQAVCADFDHMHLPRITQLINKSNQFHLTTTRYSEAQIQSMMTDVNTLCRYFKMKDRFGDNGLISVVILKREDPSQLSIDTWVMSCRVLMRGIEDLICNEMIEMARSMGCRDIVGTYIPTSKNRIVEKLYPQLGFVLSDEHGGTTIWRLCVADQPAPRKTFIQKVESY
jgi:FkbH-like protein